MNRVRVRSCPFKMKGNVRSDIVKKGNDLVIYHMAIGFYYFDDLKKVRCLELSTIN
jgi:hypothetical protein